MPLKWEDIVDATDLRDQITAFLAQRRLNRKGGAAAGEPSVGGEGGSDAMAVDL